MYDFKDKIILQGDKVLIQLLPFPKEAPSKSGLAILKIGVGVTESGLPTAVIDDSIEYQDRGVVLQIAPKALKTLSETHPDVKEGSIVWIANAANSPHFQFLPDKESRVQNFTGLLTVHTGHIEAVEINSNTPSNDED